MVSSSDATYWPGLDSQATWGPLHPMSRATPPLCPLSDPLSILTGLLLSSAPCTDGQAHPQAPALQVTAFFQGPVPTVRLTPASLQRVQPCCPYPRCPGTFPCARWAVARAHLHSPCWLSCSRPSVGSLKAWCPFSSCGRFCCPHLPPSALLCGPRSPGVGALPTPVSGA